MISIDDRDESLERELFALRERVLPEPVLDVAGVFARVRRRERERAARARFVAWMGAATCAAASLVLAVSDVRRVDTQNETYVTNDDASMMCVRVPASRLPHEVLESKTVDVGVLSARRLESHDDTNVCIGP